MLLDSQNPGWQIHPGLATTLANNLMNNWNVQPSTHFTAYDQEQMGAGTTVANGFYTASNYELADVGPLLSSCCSFSCFSQPAGESRVVCCSGSFRRKHDRRHVFRFDTAGRTKPSLDGRLETFVGALGCSVALCCVWLDSAR